MITVGVAAVLSPASTATAAEGPAPQPREHRIIAGVHTDAVSTFLDDGRLALASRADVAEGNGTRLAAEDIWFHLADDAKATVPAGYEFLAPAGRDVWIAPESNPGPGRLWPGFSTESVPAGAIEGDQTTFTLTGLEGPGSVELFTAGGFGGAKRLWSSDEDGLTSFSVGRTHMHANWAFTTAGTYRISVRAAVTVDGEQQTAQAVYTFVVGGLPTAAATRIAVQASATTVVAGDRVTLDATVTPPDAPGWVEFLDGDTVLGHAAVSGGQATLATGSLPLGSRSLSARFVPQVLNRFARSASDPVTVTVTERAGGEVFAVTGVADRYAAGEQIDLRIAGATLDDGERWRWIIRAAGTTEYVVGETDRFRRDATVALDQAEVWVEIVDARNKTVQESGRRTLRVDGPNTGTGEPVVVAGLQARYYSGDPVRVSVEHRALASGETSRWVSRIVPGGAEWTPVPEYGLPKAVPGTPGAYTIDAGWLNQNEWAYEILDAGGAVIGRSPAFLAEIVNRELMLSGVRTVYRAGDTLEASSELYPARDDVVHEWALSDDTAFAPIPDATSASLELPITADLDGKWLSVWAMDATGGYAIAGAHKQLRVTDAAPGEQMLFLDSLSGHYHQGSPIRLSASADPAASATDTYRWLWKRADQADFVPMDKITSATHEVPAEQALHGTQVKAELRTAAGELLATSEPATISVDDHGAAPRQKVTVGGLAGSYRAGENVQLTAAVAPASVLTRWEWYAQPRGEDTPQVVPGQNSAQLSLTAAAELDGATVFARLTFDDGRRYVDSTPVVLRVTGAGEPGPTLSVSGLSDGEYQPGDAVTLQAVQSPQGPLTTYQWFAKRPDDADFSPVGGETGAAYGFTATRELHGAQYQVTLYDGETVVATSAAVTLEVAAGQPGGSASKSVTATISETDGALVISVDDGDRAVTLPAAELNASGDRWESAGALKPVTVTDTRSGRPGWSASGQLADGFRAADGKAFTGGYLGWTPSVVQQGGQQGVVAGPVTAPDVSGRPTAGLGGSAPLATAPGGAGRGTARLDAALKLSVPTDTAAGTYTGVLTLTAI